MSVWIFQAVPQYYNLEEKLVGLRGDFWAANQHRKEMAEGDKVIFWQAGKKRGIYGIGRLTSAPYYNWKSKKWRVDLEYIESFQPPILEATCRDHPVLKRLRILEPPHQGTNFCATNEEWNALKGAKLTAKREYCLSQETLMEGTLKRAFVNLRERNAKAREVCLEHHGYNCAVCGFNFEVFFGEHGKGFIHVHHLKQLSKSKKQRKVNGILDLRPICPNCHAMIHKSSKMMSIEKLTRLIRKSRRDT